LLDINHCPLNQQGLIYNIVIAKLKSKAKLEVYILKAFYFREMELLGHLRRLQMALFGKRKTRWHCFVGLGRQRL